MLQVRAVKRRGTFLLDVGFELKGPGVIALFGRSGCGKSTTVDILAGLLRPDAGRIELDDTVLLDSAAHLEVPAERRRIGYVFQDARLFPHLSIAGNLRYAANRATGPVYVGLDGVVDLLGLGGLMDRRTHQLSGGERQRVAIGRALLSQPRLLLLDEPLAALDSARRAEILPYLESLRDQLAVPMVYVTHDFEEVLRLATHLVLLVEGTTVAQGPVGDMSLDPRLRAIIGPDAVGAILDGVVMDSDSGDGLIALKVGNGQLQVRRSALTAGQAVRVQVLARDVIVSTELPRGLSVRNALAGVIVGIQADDSDSDIITLDVGAARLMARVTKAATEALSLRPGMPAWALVKTVSLRGRSFNSRASRDA